jgi:hypothetical protein
MMISASVTSTIHNNASQRGYFFLIIFFERLGQPPAQAPSGYALPGITNFILVQRLKTRLAPKIAKKILTGSSRRIQQEVGKTKTWII